jgi:hypothetical protein
MGGLPDPVVDEIGQLVTEEGPEAIVRANQILMLGEAAVLAIKTFAFPLLLGLLVIMFLLIQHWLDKKAPKLALAPVHSRHDMVDFD